MNLVILGSARTDSDTLKAVKKLCPVTDYNLVDLCEKRVGHYSYDHSRNDGDDFLAIVQQMQTAETIIFATPVYWYAMSGIMKVFFDRLTELLSTYKAIGKSLKGKRVYLISSGSDPELPPGFETPFKLTCEYFQMNYVGALYRSTRCP